MSCDHLFSPMVSSRQHCVHMRTLTADNTSTQKFTTAEQRLLSDVCFPLSSDHRLSLFTLPGRLAHSVLE